MNESIDVGNRARTYTVVGEPSTEPRALIMVFHGSRQTGAIHREFTGGALDGLAAEGRAVVAYLDGYRGNWNDARRESSFPARLEEVDDVGFARAVVARLTATHGIDPRRVVVVGYSNGGQMALRLLHETPDLVAGAVVVAATMPDERGFTAGFSTAPQQRPVPVTIVAGTADPIVPYSGGRMRWWARKLFKIDGAALSAEATADYFASRNGIRATPTIETLPAASRRTRTTRTDYRADGRPSVSLVTVIGGGHTVPAAKAGPAVVGATGHDLTIDRIVSQMLDEVAVDAIGSGIHPSPDLRQTGS
ncbi:alpha/beta fold hydrolase [Microbacterium sp. AZCO]|uniref:alpha/beta hydrolase family esterase n=1 Tax=Microbacterium sp. AZCO TaxID=3142976 RepID=UPI0031F35D3A